MMDFRYDFQKRMFYWSTRCGGYDAKNKEIRLIRLFNIVKQGFVCDNWEEAIMLAGYFQNKKNFKKHIEDIYKWVPDYLELRKENHFLETIAIPVAVYLDYYAKYGVLPYQV